MSLPGQQFTPRPLPVCLSNLLGGAGLAMLVLGSQAPHALAAGALSQGSVGLAPVASSLATNLAAEQQAQSVGLQAQNQLSRIATAMQAMQNMQTSARKLALTAPNTVPNGLTPNGLVPNNPASWTAAQAPVQSNISGRTTVTINQTAAQALLSWNSFNVGANTTVDFNQQGNSNWVALNQISPTGVPSKILGSIQASGQVYLINPNGIIFGGASQVNVGALIASSAQLSDSQFLTNGIYGPNSGTTPSFTQAAGNIIVQPGAVIATSAPASVSAGGGFVLMMGRQVVNGGSISTPVGQTELAAGDNFYLRPGYSTTSNDSSTTRGNEIAVKLMTNGSSLTGGSGLVQNNGDITADTGDITLVGETVQQNGLALATTSVAYRGTIHLLSSATDRFSSVTLGSNAYTLIEPDLSSSATGLDSQRAGLLADAANANNIRLAAVSGVFNDLSPLGDLEDESRIEIVSGNTVEFQGGSDSSAPGGQIAVYAANRVQVDTAALLDVSGSYAVPMSMSSNDIAVNVQNYELRDNPQNRLTGSLSDSTVYVNAQNVSLVPASASDPNVRDYSAGGLFEVSGYLANTGHTIGEYTAVGGSITLATGAKGAVVGQAGSTFNIDGGSLQYGSGYLQQSYLLATNGQIYNANNAPASLTYAGVYNGFTEDHARWNVTQSFGDLLHAPPEIYQQGYLVGRAAGSLTLSSPTSIFDGTVDASTVNGPAQTAADPTGVTDPYLYTQSEVAEPGTLTIGNLAVANLTLGHSNVIFGSTAPQAVSVDDPIPDILNNTTYLSAATLNNAGLGGLEVFTNDRIKVEAPLSLAPGAAVSLYGSSIDIAANVTAAGGSFTASQLAPNGLVAQSHGAGTGPSGVGAIVVANDATISTAGIWTNLALDPNITFTQAFINGGAVDLASVDNLTLDTGTNIDSSAGGYAGLKGATQAGTGGAITLEAGIQNPLTTTPVGNLKLGATLESVGGTGGALTLYAPHFLISTTELTPAPASVVQLNPAFFTQGFSAYNLQSSGDIVVAPGTVVNVTEPTYLATAATTSVPTGAAPAAAFALTLQPLYTANTNATAITQRAGASFSAQIISPLSIDPAGRGFIDRTTLLIGANAAINVDPGQSIKLQSVSQLTIDGSLNAPGGTISATSLYNTQAALPGPGTVSIWLGPNAVLNTSSQAVSFENAQGDRISRAPAGGTVILGTDTSTASVILRKGALVEASGSAATDQITASALNLDKNTAQPFNQAIPVEGAGGSISLASEEGIYNNGALIAAAGGPDAAGGSLTMILEADFLPNATDTAEATPRIFTITQNTGASLPAHLKPGSSKGLVIGTASLSQQQIAGGGFGNVTLFTRDAFLFQGDVTLSAPQSITLEEGYFTDSSRQGSVTLDAPYVMLGGNTPQDTNNAQNPLSLISGFSARQATGIFTVNAATIAINNSVRFGGLLPRANGSSIDLAGFGAVQLNATGDLQFVAPSDYSGGKTSGANDNLVTTANLTLTAREIYALDPTGPQVGAYNPSSALIVAGYDPVASTANGNFNPKKGLTIRQTPGTVAAAPETLAGQLTFVAPTISQGGVVWQPFGGLTFGQISSGTVDGFNFTGDPKATVSFLPGSITSVSAAGLNVPFGGTTDGVTYDVNGSAISTASSSLGLNTVSGGVGPGTIAIAALNTDIQPGATIDLRGGGTLTGAGFISGENGSTDVLTTPLLNISTTGVSQPGLATDQVYAIVAGAQPEAAVAYTQSGATGSTPGPGQQIIIPAGVPGLPAGAYTLLPAQYALEPGGYRVEFDGAAALDAAPVAGLPNGSYAVAGYTALAGTNVRATLATNVTITPGATVLNYAGYDQEAYSPFLLANATRLDELRPVLPIDAGTLVLNVPVSSHVSLINDGSVDFAAAAGGVGGVLQIGSGNAGDFDLPNFNFYNTTPASDLPRNTVSLSAPQIDAFNPYILEIGAAGKGTAAGVNSITLESGATLTAARVVLTAQAGGITLLSGSGIDTINQGTLPVDSTTEGLLSNGGATVLDVGNGYLVYGTAPILGVKYGPITVQDGAFIYTDGSIAFSTSGAVNIGTGASYGGKYIDLAVPVINIGDTTGLGANAPAGVALTEAELQALTAGTPDLDVPAVQIVNLTAFDSLNFYGDAALDLTDPGVQLEINTPAIYGYGGGADAATIAANTIVWNGIPALAANGNTIISSAPGATDPQGPGSGTGMLDLQASTIILGFSALDLPQRDVSLARLTAGFSTVNLNASSEIIANNQGTLAVYQSLPTYGQPGKNGILNLNTPLLTADDGAIIGFTAGGNINLSPYPGAANATSLPSESAGGEIDLTGENIAFGSSVILPSGKLDVQASGNIGLAAGSLLDLAGAVTQNSDQTVYGFGGDLVMASADGNITQAPGSVINVGATNNTAGSVSITATDAANGQVSLQGTLLGASTGNYTGGAFSIEAQSIGDFAALNSNLDAGGFFQSRSFDIQQGDLTIGNGLEAQNVSVSLDNGSLTVTGLIDASFGGGGAINLAASNNLTLASSARLDAHGTVLNTDSNGAAIASENAPSVTLTSSNGFLTLDGGATIDLASADSTARGDLELNAPRSGGSAASATDGQSISDPVDGNVTTGAGGPANAQGDNIAISASQPLNITGAATIALNGTATYANAPVPDPKNPNSQIIDQNFLDLVNTDSVAFENAALTNPALASKITGLTAYGSTVFHVRPGVQIVSASPTGDLTVEGDINLVGYRYGPGAVNFDPDQEINSNPDVGTGQPGTLAIRAGGNLNIYGSITDGFAQPVSDTGTEFANGWVIFGGKQPFEQIQVLPQPITVTTGSTLPANAVVNFAVPIAAGGRLEVGAVAPVPLTVDGDQHTQTAFTATSAILTSGGQTLFAQGQLVPAHSLIPDGAVIEAGGSLPFAVKVDQVMWPANTPLAVTSNVGYGDGTAVKLGIDTTITTGRNAGAILPANAVIPAGSVLEFAPDTPGLSRPLNSQGQPLRLADGSLAPETVNTRLPANGSQGQLYGLAPQLPAGDLSWGIDLVAGADTAAACANVVQAASLLGDTGNLVLADPHYGVDINNSHPHNVTETVVPAFSVVRTGTGALTLAAGGSIDEESSFGVYTAGTQSSGVASNDNLPQGTTKDGTVLGAQNAGLNALIANYAAYYPTNGGNVLVSAQGDLNGFINIGFEYQPYSAFNTVQQLTDSDAIGGWLWLQGGEGQPGAWWTNYGALDLAPGSNTVQMTGFQGIGTLGGGNLTVNAGRNASGLDLVVASNGRVTPAGTLENGGGTLSATIGGTVNFTEAIESPVNLPSVEDAAGVISDLRGDATISAGSIGTVQPIYKQVNGADPRFLSPLASEEAGFANGFDLALGDSTATIDTRGDLAIGDSLDPGTVQNFVNLTPVAGFAAGSGGVTNFSLWTASTSTDLFSAGGDVVPVESNNQTLAQNEYKQLVYTPSLLATAQNGNIYIGQSQELAPSPGGQLQLLAADSIIGISDPTLSISGASLALVATPSDPEITVTGPSGGVLFTNHNSLSAAEPIEFGLDTATSALHENDPQPARIYAATGDVLGIEFGVYLPARNGQSQQVIAAKPFDIYAGRDIVDSGTLLNPDIFLNLNPTDISSVTAGRDIIESSFDIAGPGNLVVQAGRNLYEADQGAIVSLGRVFGITPANRDTGAGVSVLAGVGSGPDYASFATEFLSQDSTLNLDDVSTIIQSDDATLYAWLQTNAGYTGPQAGAYAFFQTLPAAQQDVFLRALYFDLLNNSGLEFNNPDSPHYKSYILGQDAIASLFPANVTTGNTAPDTGDITLFGPSGVQTLFGGTIEALTPGGNTIVGVEGTTPPSTAGFITQGSGDIDIYAQDSVLLGESRVITTFGGNIVVWSALGNINAGRGSKTTIDYTPVQRLYDNYGNVFLSPTVPSSGAGIATLAPIPGVPPGNINLIAPVGTVDAGEAGIRGSGNLNIAALHVLNAANINVQGATTGVPTAVAPDVGGLTSAGNAAGAAAQAAENAAPKQQAAPLPSIWIVEILGYGGGSAPDAQDQKKKHLQTISSLSSDQTKQALLF